MDLKLRVWRQEGPTAPGKFVDYDVPNVSPDMSFLELFDVLNEQLLAANQEPVAFDHDCREGICGSCSMMINGRAHGPETGTATCQLHVAVQDGDHITVEPWRRGPSRSSLTCRVRSPSIGSSRPVVTAPRVRPDGNIIPVPKEASDQETRRMHHGAWRRARTALHTVPGQGRTPRPLPQGQPSVTSAPSTWSRRWRATWSHVARRVRRRRESASTSSRCHRDDVKAQFKPQAQRGRGLATSRQAQGCAAAARFLASNSLLRRLVAVPRQDSPRPVSGRAGGRSGLQFVTEAVPLAAIGGAARGVNACRRETMFGVVSSG